MACFAGPSFQEANGSCAWVLVEVKATTPTSAAASRFSLPRRLVAPKHRSVGGSAAKAGVRLVFIALSFLIYGFLKLSESRFFDIAFSLSSKAGHYTPGAGIGPKNIRGTAGLTVVIGEQDAVFGDRIDVRRPAHHAVGVGAEVPHPDVTAQMTTILGLPCLPRRSFSGGWVRGLGPERVRQRAPPPVVTSDKP